MADTKPAPPHPDNRPEGAPPENDETFHRGDSGPKPPFPNPATPSGPHEPFEQAPTTKPDPVPQPPAQHQKK